MNQPTKATKSLLPRMPYIARVTTEPDVPAAGPLAGDEAGKHPEQRRRDDDRDRLPHLEPQEDQRRADRQIQDADVRRGPDEEQIAGAAVPFVVVDQLDAARLGAGSGVDEVGVVSLRGDHGVPLGTSVIAIGQLPNGLLVTHSIA